MNSYVESEWKRRAAQLEAQFNVDFGEIPPALHGMCIVQWERVLQSTAFSCSILGDEHKGGGHDGR